jgi:hypothetical protein
MLPIHGLIRSRSEIQMMKDVTTFLGHVRRSVLTPTYLSARIGHITLLVPPVSAAIRTRLVSPEILALKTLKAIQL